MEYPVVSNWVTFSKTECGGYYVFDEAFDEQYRMSDGGDSDTKMTGMYFYKPDCKNDCRSNRI